MSYQEKNFLGDLGSSSYLNYGQEVLDVLNISQLLSSNSLLNSNKLESYLTQTIAQCQKHYIGQPELATESDSKVVFLCLILEQIFSHGLRNKINFSSTSTNIQKLLEYIREFQISSKSRLEFWNCVSFILPNQERERFLSLKLICTDTGRGRAWLRSTLNERSLERYLKCLQDEPEVLEQFYESKAWIRDKDKYRVLLKAAADISPIVFALDIDSPDLNTSSPEQNHLLLRHCTEPEIIPSTNTTTLSPTQSNNSPRGTPPNNGSVSPSKFRRSKKPSQSIISFDDTGENKGVAVTKIESIESAMKIAGKRDVFETDQLIYNDDLERKNLAELAENGPLSELQKNFETINVNTTSSSSVQDIFPFSKENSASSGTSQVSKLHNTHSNSITQSATSNVNYGAQNCDSHFNNSQSISGPTSARDSTTFSSSNYAQSVSLNSQSALSNFQSNSHVAPSNNSQPHLNLVSSNTYLNSNNPSNTYLTPSNTYLTSTNPSNTYLTPSNNSSTPYLAPSNLEFSNPSLQRIPSNNSSTPYLAPSNNSSTPYLAPSNNSSTHYLAPSNLEFSNPSSRSSQDSLLEADCLSSEVDLMSVSQYSEARSDLSIDHRSVTGDLTMSTMEDGGSSVYSNAHSTQGRGGGGAEFSSLRLMGDTGIGELTPLTSYIATSSYISSQPGLDNALDASLYADEYSGCPQGIDAATLYGDGTRCSQSQEFEEDSLSICSTSDGGVSTSVPLPGSRRNGGAGQMGGEGMDEKRDARYEAQIQELNRENELLKHQLRKYVTAVQLLNTDQQQHIVPSLSTNPNNTNSTSGGASSSSLEAESEARSYEKKLIQLAEMHSELLEMNQRLKIDLLARESTVTKLTSELMILRGVKPSPVSLWLPCVFLGGPPSDPHHIYQIHIRVGTEEWNVYRRYSDFYTFNKTLHRRYPKTIKQLSPQVKFPPKNLIFNKGNKSALFVEERRQKLELYLRAIVTTLVDYEFGTSSASVTSTMTPSSERKLNKYALVTLVPFLNDFYKSANVARHSPLGSATSNTPAPSSINPIKRLSTSMNIVGNCLKPNPSSPTSPEDNVSSSNNNSTGTLQYNGL